MPAPDPANISHLTILLQDQSNPHLTRESAARDLVQIANTHPDYRSQCIAILTAALERYQRNPIELNTSLISHLIDLKAKESAAMIQQVIKAGEYDRQSLPDWSTISKRLGIVATQPTPSRPLPASDTAAKPEETFAPNPALAAATIASAPHLTPKQKDKLRAKRKQERKARKQNRRR
ncbi:MAG TPA: hypothetical protein VGQ99_13440 [Tepidisphaeraceae bacterium]|nr:hypothetical protein [Tepidisphaeraceae bacterium]